jgi:hypothetical protein
MWALQGGRVATRRNARTGQAALDEAIAYAKQLSSSGRSQLPGDPVMLCHRAGRRENADVEGMPPRTQEKSSVEASMAKLAVRGGAAADKAM